MEKRVEITNLDKQAQKIHKSTKTLLFFFSPIHNWLRKHFNFYYKWHLNPYAGKIHIGFVIFYTFFIVLLIGGFAFYPELQTQVKAASTTLRPSSAGSYTEWTGQTPGSGAHWDKVDDITPDEDATKVTNPPDQGRELYNTTNSVPSGSTINSVQITVRKFDAGEAMTLIGFKDGTGEYWQYVNDDSGWQWADVSTDVWTTNPRTGAAWTWSQIDALEIGFKNAGYTSGVTQVYAVVDYTAASPPAAPTAGTPSALSTSSIRWNFTDNASDETGFRVHDASHTIKVQQATPNLTYLDEGSLSANTQYTRHIHAYNGNGDSSPSADMTKYTLSSNPTGATATDGTYTDKINVSWSSGGAQNHYHVYRDGVSGVGTLVYDNTGTSFDNTITGSHTYYVYSVNGDSVESASYSSDTGYTLALPFAPTAGSPSALSTTSIRWNFTDNASNETGFRVHDSSHTVKVEQATPDLTYLDETGLSPNTQYTRHIHAYNAAGDSTASADMTRYTLCNAPTSSTATPASPTQINISWTVPSGGANHYHVRSSSDAYATLKYDDTGTSTSESGLSANTQYTYRIWAVNSDGAESATYAEVSKYTLANAPGTPTVTAIPATQLNVIIDQNSNPANTAYTIQETGSSNYVNKTTGALQVGVDWGTYAEFGGASGKDVVSLSANTQYTFKVKARNGDSVETDFSGTSSKYTLANIPGTPTTSVVSVSSLNVIIDQNSNPAGTNYAIQETGSSNYVQADGTLSGSAVWQDYATWGGGSGKNVTGLSANTQYTFKVKAKNGDSVETDFSGTSSKYTLANTPTGPGATADSISQITASWSAPSGGANHYHVRSSSDAYATLKYNDTSTSTSESGLSANTQYTYRIWAVNADGVESATYAEVSKYTLANAPGTPTVTAIPATQLNVIIDQNSNPANTAYTIQETGSSNYVNKTTGALQVGVDWGTYAEFGGASGKDVVSLSANTQYTFKVKARNGDSTETSFGGTQARYTLSDDPTGATATDGTYPDKIAVSWSSGGAQNHYHVYRDGISGVGTLVHNDTPTSFDDVITGNHNYYAYSVNAEAVESSGYSSDSGSTMVGPDAPTAGTPTALSSTSIRWNFTDNASNEEGFRAHDGAHTVMVEQATPDLTYLDETSLIPAFQYTRHIHAYNAFGDSTPSGNMTIYTLANIPGASTVTAVSQTSLNILIDQNSNSAAAQYAIQETGSGNYVQADGSLSASAVWQDYATWGGASGKNVTGLSANTQYTFKTKARNGDNVETEFSGTSSKYTLIEEPLSANWNTVTQTLINLGASGTLSNLTVGSSGIYFRESVTSANTGWIQSNVWNKSGLSVNTQYHFYITTRNADGTANAEAGPYDKYTLANTPTATTASAVSGTSINVIINQNSNPAGTGYAILEETSGNYVNKNTGVLQPGADWGTYAEFGSAGGINVVGLSANTQYTFRAKARNGENQETSFSDSSSKYTLIEQPTGVSWDTVGTDAILLSATGTLSNLTVGSSGIYFENITAGTNSGWVQTNSWNNSSLIANKQYAYQATARNADGVSNAPVSLGNKYTKALSSNVSGDRSISTWYNSGNFTFTNNIVFGEGGVAYYRYVWDQNATHSFNDTETQWSTGTKAMTPTADGSWYFHAKSYNGENVSGGTQTYGPYFYDATPSSIPQTLSATATSTSQINLSWTASTDATSGFYRYIVYSSTDGTTFNQIGYATGNSYSDYGLTAGTTYYYKVKSSDNALNVSDFSNSASAMTQSPPAPPEQPSQPPTEQQQQPSGQQQIIPEEPIIIVGEPVDPSSVDAQLGDSNLSVPLIITDNQTKVLGELVKSVHIKVELSDTASATAIIGGQEVTLINTGGNIYEADVPLPKEPGSYTIKVKSTKTDGTVVEQQTLTVLVDPYGYVYDSYSKARIANAEVTLFEKDDQGQWKKWDASKYSQANPQNTNRSGDYGFMTQKGTYYLAVTAPGYKDYKSEEITVKSDPITVNVPLEPIKIPFWNTERIIIGVLGIIILLILTAGFGLYVYRKRD